MRTICQKCGLSEATTMCGDEAYCDHCKKVYTYGTNHIFQFLDINGMTFREHSIKGTIYTSKTEKLKKFLCDFNYEWWFGANNGDTIFIEVKRNGSA